MKKIVNQNHLLIHLPDPNGWPSHGILANTGHTPYNDHIRTPEHPISPSLPCYHRSHPRIRATTLQANGEHRPRKQLYTTTIPLHIIQSKSTAYPKSYPTHEQIITTSPQDNILTNASTQPQAYNIMPYNQHIKYFLTQSTPFTRKESEPFCNKSQKHEHRIPPTCHIRKDCYTLPREMMSFSNLFCKR
jgi:hypothetical protein